ncbi:terminase small subunit-like protein [Empedobacter falsenii]
MAKQSKSQIVKEWKSSSIKIKKDSKGLLWVVLGKEKVRLPKDLTNVKFITLSQAEGFLGLENANLIVSKTYSQEEKNEVLSNIFLQIKLKGYSVRKIFKEDNSDKPEISRNTFHDWLSDDKEMADQYARAREERADGIFEEILDIVDCEDNDVTEIDIDGILVTRVNHDVIQRDRLRVDARKWILAKMNPKKYGDKIDHTSNGETITTPARILTKKEAQELYNSLENDY